MKKYTDDLINFNLHTGDVGVTEGPKLRHDICAYVCDPLRLPSRSLERMIETLKDT